MKKEIEIYRQSFGTDPAFEGLLFRIRPVTLKIEGETVSQLFLLPCIIKNRETSLNAHYVFAVATEEKHRRKGYMEKLLKSVIDGEILILRPSSEALTSYYKKLGFEAFTATDSQNKDFFVEPLGNFKALAENEDKTQDGEFTLMAVNSPIDLNGIYFPYTLP